ncbi:histidinol-phosphatase [Candidatus Laterigemmans baculatus]|uniref:histidinol-phosphatase n=1 Tax=Candidatus Laterigemmans baculatus TaxID=2770505 RepID=UPI001F163754|nr:histidinol-phosphatase [Candidatus Laterigemmans baculatus]
MNAADRGHGAVEGPGAWQSQYEGRLQSMLEAAELAAAVTLRYFGGHGLDVEAKSDDSPVTVADRTAEAEFRSAIGRAYRDDGLLGEEHGEAAGSSDYRWVVDPIDGTKSFIAGVPLYSTLVALESRGEPVAGGIWIPALGEAVVAAKGLGAWHRASPSSPWKRSQVSARGELAKAIFVTTQIDSFSARGSGQAFEQLQQAAWITRTWGDGYGYFLVATGRADVMVDPIVNPWDVAAIRPVIEEAGGRFSDWSGVATTKSGDAVGTNGPLHEEVLRLLR